MADIQTRRDRFRDDGGTPMWRVRHQSWYQRSSPQRIFITVLFGLLALLTIGPIVALLVCWAVVP